MGLCSFFQIQQPVGKPDHGNDLGNRGIRIGGDHDNLGIRIEFVDFLDGADTIPSRRHPHVDENHGVWFAVLQSSSE